MTKDQIAILEADIAAKAERLKRMKARIATQERKATNKRRYLIGAMIEGWMKDDPSMDDTVRKRLAEFLTRESDRRYFGFAPIPKSEAGPSQRASVTNPPEPHSDPPTDEG